MMLFWIPGANRNDTLYLYNRYFFLAYFSIKQKSIFPSGKKISLPLLPFSNRKNTRLYNRNREKRLGIQLQLSLPGKYRLFQADPKRNKVQRLDPDRLASLSMQLKSLMEIEKLYLDNELNLPAVADKLGISIHDTSFLINETTGQKFLQFHQRLQNWRSQETAELLQNKRIEYSWYRLRCRVQFPNHIQYHF